MRKKTVRHELTLNDKFVLDLLHPRVLPAGPQTASHREKNLRTEEGAPGLMSVLENRTEEIP